MGNHLKCYSFTKYAVKLYKDTCLRGQEHEFMRFRDQWVISLFNILWGWRLMLYPVQISSVSNSLPCQSEPANGRIFHKIKYTLLVQTELGKCPLWLGNFTDCAGNSRHRRSERTTFAEGNLRIYKRNPFRVRKTPKKWNSLFKYGRAVINLVPTLNFHNILFGVKNVSAGECPVHIVLSTSVDCGKIVFDHFLRVYLVFSFILSMPVAFFKHKFL